MNKTKVISIIALPLTIVCLSIVELFASKDIFLWIYTHMIFGDILSGFLIFIMFALSTIVTVITLKNKWRSWGIFSYFGYAIITVIANLGILYYLICWINYVNVTKSYLGVIM